MVLERAIDDITVVPIVLGIRYLERVDAIGSDTRYKSATHVVDSWYIGVDFIL